MSNNTKDEELSKLMSRRTALVDGTAVAVNAVAGLARVLDNICRVVFT